MNTTMQILIPVTARIQVSLRHRREARAHRRALQAELASFVTPADRLEIESIADRYPDEQSREVREILLGQDVSG